ncbi:hypothetical protein, partial [Klebsiella pneumoniae]|uniref:hypothetical protein n=1 Tax=Klebsiella pneumoniae TaxID=573 RepID=UPI001C60879B
QLMYYYQPEPSISSANPRCGANNIKNYIFLFWTGVMPHSLRISNSPTFVMKDRADQIPPGKE